MTPTTSVDRVRPAAAAVDPKVMQNVLAKYGIKHTEDIGEWRRKRDAKEAKRLGMKE
jgi:hypothetical protein